MRCGFSRAVWCLISFEELKFLPSDSSAMYRSGHDSRPRGDLLGPAAQSEEHIGPKGSVSGLNREDVIR